MAGAPVAALAFGAAATAIQGATYLAGRSAANSQSRVDEAAINFAREQSRLRAAQAAAQSAVGFRKALASQLALASMRGGTGSVARQFGSESYANFLTDQENINSYSALGDLTALNQVAQSKANHAAGNAKGLTNVATTALNSFNLSSFGGS